MFRVNELKRKTGLAKDLSIGTYFMLYTSAEEDYDVHIKVTGDNIAHVSRGYMYSIKDKNDILNKEVEIIKMISAPVFTYLLDE